MPEPPRPVPECRHILPSGRKCHSVALRGKLFCYRHSRSRSLVDANRTRKHSIAIPPLEDRTAIQMSLDQVFAALAASKIDRRTAGLYLYGLQIAAQNFARLEDSPAPGPVNLTRDDQGDVIAAEEPPETHPAPPAIDPGQDQALPAPAALVNPILENPVPDLPIPDNPVSDESLSGLDAQDCNSRATNEYDPEPPPRPSRKEQQQKLREVEQALRSARSAKTYYSGGEPGARDLIVSTYIQQQIDSLEAERSALLAENEADPPP